MKYVLLLMSLCVCVNAYNILVFYAQPLRSLNILGQGVVKHLLNAGHEVTYVTAYPSKGGHVKNYKEIDLSSMQGAYDSDEADVLNISYVMANSDQTNNVPLLQELGLFIARKTLLDENLQDLLLDKTQRFDAVVIDYLETEVYAGIAAIYECPLIWGYSMGPNSISLQLVDETTNPAYTEDLLSSNIHPFSFQQRVEQLWNAIVWNYNKWFRMYPKHEDTYNEIFGPIAEKLGKKLPKYEDIVHNSSLVLSNFHYAFGSIPNLPQNFRMIGGYYIDRPTKPLPKDLQSLMDSAENGVIYFSMGSTWKSKDIPASVTQGLLEVFGELKQTVIWKYEEVLPNLPKNVHILKWAPQQSVLAHPNLLFFITHGGLLSSTETIHFAVPQIGIPIYFDQFINVNRAVANGYAIRVDLNFDLPKNLKVAIDTMLRDSSYQVRAKHLSALYHDRPMEPSTEMVWWIEHVIRTGGAPHLSPPSHAVPWYQKNYLDLAAVVVLVSVLLVRFVSTLCKGKKRKNQKSKRE